jgi:tetratricopeptide (TPR) repeat protein
MTPMAAIVRAGLLAGMLWAPAVAVPAAPQTPPALAAADEAMRLGRFDQAARQYEAWLAEHPDTPDVLFALGVCRIQMGRAREAVGVLRRYVELAPDAARGHAALGVALMDAASMADARRALDRALALDPSAPGAREALARIHLVEGDAGKAVALLRPAADAPRAQARDTGRQPADGRRDEFRALLAESLIQSGSAAEAATLLESDLAADPQRPPQIYALACLARIKAAELERAAATCEQGMRLHPDSEIEGVYLSLPPGVLGARTAARLAAISRAPDAAEMIALGRVLTDVDPNRRTRAATLARQLLDDAVALAPASASAHYNLGRTLREDDVAGALAAWEKALTLSPDDELRLQILTQVARARESLADVDGADTAFVAALEINRRLPRRVPEVALDYVRFLQLHGRTAEAQPLLDEIVAWSPWAPAVRVERAQLLAEQGRWQDVVAEGTFVLQHAHDDTRLLRVAHLLLARAYFRLGQPDTARVHREWLESH